VAGFTAETGAIGFATATVASTFSPPRTAFMTRYAHRGSIFAGMPYDAAMDFSLR